MITYRDTQGEPYALPEDVDSLIEMLDRAFPEQCPTLGTPLDRIWHYSGQRSIVHFLRHLQKRRDTPEET